MENGFETTESHLLNNFLDSLQTLIVWLKSVNSGIGWCLCYALCAGAPSCHFVSLCHFLYRFRGHDRIPAFYEIMEEHGCQHKPLWTLMKLTTEYMMNLVCSCSIHLQDQFILHLFDINFNFCVILSLFICNTVSNNFLHSSQAISHIGWVVKYQELSHTKSSGIQSFWKIISRLLGQLIAATHSLCEGVRLV